MAHRIVCLIKEMFSQHQEREREMNFKFLHHIYYLMVVPFIAWHWCIYVPIVLMLHYIFLVRIAYGSLDL